MHVASLRLGLGSLLFRLADFALACVFVSHTNMMTQFSETGKFAVEEIYASWPK
jgi:hypothetical protein